MATCLFRRVFTKSPRRSQSHSGVQIVGVGWSVAGIGTTIRASSNFPANAPFPSNIMLAIDGTNDTYGAGASILQ